MKKLLVLVVMLFCSLTVYAQSPRVETMITHDGLGWMIVPKYKVNDSTQKGLNAALERAIAKQVLQAKRDSVKLDSLKQRKPVVKFSRKQWLRAIFLNGPFPGESKEAYRQRLYIQSLPASQPFK